MRRVALIAWILLGFSSPRAVEARIAVEPLRRVLRAANDDIRTCRARHGLRPGRYSMLLRIDHMGKVDDVVVRRAPADLDAAAESCLEAAFTRLRFGARVSSPTNEQVEAAPRSHLPPERRGGLIDVHWPFVLGEQL